MKKIAIILIIGIVAVVVAVALTVERGESYYSMEDYYAVKKVDGHVHIGSDDPGLLEQAARDNFIILSIVTEVPDYPAIDDQEDDCLSLMKRYPGAISYLTTFETETINEPGWTARTIDKLKDSFEQGATGIKVWKNIGMVIKDENGEFIQIDDPVFTPVFDLMVEKDLPVMGHIGEPRSCWLPIDEMVVNNDKNYFSRYPEYHMYLHPENPSYETLIAARDSVLIRHPDLTFVGAHMGSMEWSVDMIIEHLDRFPNFSVDLTDRICYLQHQSVADWQKVHDFFVDYQDRIMYGTDIETWDSVAADVTQKNAHEIWLRDWEYFTSDKSLTAPAVNGSFRGLKLAREVVDKIYYRNAVRTYPGLAEEKL